MIKIWGISSCQTVKNARTWLTHHDIEHEFCDFKKNLFNYDLLKAWLAQVNQEKLVNRRGTSWRLLNNDERSRFNKDDKIIDLLLDKPSLIKRPVMTSQNNDKEILLIGFNSELYSHQFQIK